MTEYIEKYKDVVIQIATPFATGTGFYVKKYNLFVTNNHVIAGSSEVIISGKSFGKTLTNVLFKDEVHDLAFLKVPEGIELPEALLNDVPVRDGEQVIAIGHPYGLKYTATQGIVSNPKRLFNQINYIQIDAAINPGNSGGPLENTNGEIIGVNTFIIAEGNNLGFSLPASYLIKSLEEYLPINGSRGYRCKSCLYVTSIENFKDSYCPNCGFKIETHILNPKDFEPTGISVKIEDILRKIGKDVKLSRIGIERWEIEQGGAKINIVYNQTTKFVIADAWLCNLPKTNIAQIYEYMLRENYKDGNPVFSVLNQNIYLSVLVFEADLSVDSGVELFNNLMEKADFYDDILINQYGACPRLIED
jgi:serine protease Do